MNENNKKKNQDEELDNTSNEGYNNDVVFDVDGDIENDGGISKDAVRKLREKLKTCIEEKQEYLLGWQRAKADFVNARKSDEENKKEFLRFANENLIEELLPVIESFEMAFANKEVWEKVDKNWSVGIEYIYGQLIETLKRNGLEQENPLGKKFDPARHASLATVPTDDKGEDHTITEVVQRGYALHGKIVKPAKVKVAVYEEKPATDNH